MIRSLKTAVKISAFAGAFALTGCAAIPMTLNSHYTSPVNVTKVPGADKIVVDVIVKNEKKHKNEISVQKDSYGIPMAGVSMNVDKDFKRAIDKALLARGFKIGTNGNTTVEVLVKKFFVSAHNGVWTSYHTGSLNLQAMVLDRLGHVTYSRSIIISHYYHKSSLLSTGISRSINGLLTDGINKMVNDNKFIQSLMESQSSIENG